MEIAHYDPITIMPIPTELMAGRSPKDTTPRNTAVVQICLPKEQVKRLKQVAKASEHKNVSVFLRHHLEELLTTA